MFFNLIQKNNKQKVVNKNNDDNDELGRVPHKHTARLFLILVVGPKGKKINLDHIDIKFFSVSLCVYVCCWVVGESVH